MTGADFEWIKTNQSGILCSALLKTSVFARFKPKQKAQIVEEFENMNFICSFCGDGANDVSVWVEFHY